MTRRVAQFVCLTSIIALGACTLNAPQVNTVRRLLPNFDQTDQKSIDRFAWSFSLAGTQYRVYAQRVQGRRVYFGNDFGMNIVWDGDSLIIVENIPGGFGNYGSGRVLNAEGQEERWYALASMPLHRARCEPPRAWRLSDDRFGWRQTCRGKVDGVSTTSSHVVEFDRFSRLREIEASAFPGGPRFVLRRLSE